MDSFVIDNTLLNVIMMLTLIIFFVIIVDFVLEIKCNPYSKTIIIMSLIYYIVLLFINLKAGQSLSNFLGVTLFYPINLVMLLLNIDHIKYIKNTCYLINIIILFVMVLKLNLTEENTFLILTFIQLTMIQNMLRNWRNKKAYCLKNGTRGVNAKKVFAHLGYHFNQLFITSLF